MFTVTSIEVVSVFTTVAEVGKQGNRRSRLDDITCEDYSSSYSGIETLRKL
jgi:hypothetical protein